MNVLIRWLRRVLFASAALLLAWCCALVLAGKPRLSASRKLVQLDEVVAARKALPPMPANLVPAKLIHPHSGSDWPD